MMMRFSSLLLLSLATTPVASFVVMAGGASRSTATITASIRLAAVSATEEDLLKPSYEIEPIPTRIGHGFDIHRMVPIADAGQPIVIGGVTIDHKDQKVSGARNQYTE
jgi:2-C-methyl-D-erythritol 2,4-cyclodiphosphate synthase